MTALGAHASAIDPRWMTWCEVDTAALARNIASFRQWVGADVLLGAVVKSEGYGHGLALSARAFADAGADWLIVNAVDEATRLRAAGLQAPIYVVGNTSPAQAADVVAAGARVVVYDAAVVEALGAAACAAGAVVPLHVKVETGNHRQGLGAADAVALGRRIAQTAGVTLEGVSTHYADIEDTTNHGFAMAQLTRFNTAVAAFRAAGLAPPLWHSANSAATILWPQTHGGLVRPGIAAYGMWPSQETYATALASAGGFVPDLAPALSWRARVVQIKDVAVGAYIGYGRTFRATYPMRVAILPIGYFEGYDRRLSNLAHVLIDGVRAPVRGRVCMNMTMVDVTHIPSARVGAVATLLGDDGDERVSAEDLAGWMGSINYEVVSRIHPQVPRVPTP